jgi:solute carrier family 23 (nucleobase transporter), member 1
VEGRSRVPELHYGLDDVPKPFPKALALGLQHVLTMFGATVAVPFILGAASGSTPRPARDPDQLGVHRRRVATALQVTVGTRLPIVQGCRSRSSGPSSGSPPPTPARTRCATSPARSWPARWWR